MAVSNAMALNTTVSRRFSRITRLHRNTPTSSMLEKWVSMANNIRPAASGRFCLWQNSTIASVITAIEKPKRSPMPMINGLIRNSTARCSSTNCLAENTLPECSMTILSAAR
ncbi:hypothetical protein D3C75_1158130 [compost metagenome]